MNNEREGYVGWKNNPGIWADDTIPDFGAKDQKKIDSLTKQIEDVQRQFTKAVKKWENERYDEENDKVVRWRDWEEEYGELRGWNEDEDSRRPFYDIW